MRLGSGKRVKGGEETEGEMSVKPELAFDVCWEVYRCAREVMDSKRALPR